MASLRDTLANLVEQYKQSDTPLANLMRGDTEGAKQSVANAFEGMTKDPYAGLNVATPVGIAGTFIGPKSKLWNVDTHNLAKALESKGATPEEIWKQTGNVKAPDMMWRQEISDEGINLIPGYKKAIKDYGVRKQSAIIEHPELYNAYPELKDAYMQQLRASEVASGTKGTAGNNTIELNFSKDPKESLLSTALHENQHLIQDIENHAKGGSPSLFTQDLKEKVSWANQQVAEKNAQLNETYKMLEEARANKFNDPSADKRIAALKNRYDKLLDEKLSYVKDAQLDPQEEAFKQYQRLLGESEARLTQNRLPLTQQERLQYFPYAEGKFGLDLPYKELLVKELLNK